MTVAILLDNAKYINIDAEGMGVVLPCLTEEHRNRNNLIHLPFNSFGIIPFIDEARRDSTFSLEINVCVMLTQQTHN
jgi:hypothetical protein